jgi:hypothetical protein
MKGSQNVCTTEKTQTVAKGRIHSFLYMLKVSGYGNQQNILIQLTDKFGIS